MTVCDIDKCAGCMLCLEVCKKEAIHIEDSMRAYNAVIDEEKCINCNACHNKCPQNISTMSVEPIKWYQGWNRNKEIHENAPSGGVGMALALKFVEDGGYVCSCIFRNGEFVFDLTNKKEEVLNFSGSKYVKSNPIGVYKKCLDVLKNGSKVLFIGLPCQVAAIKSYAGNRYDDSLYTVDLICHGTPSPRLLERFLNQYNKSLKHIRDIKFRLKAKMQIVVDDKGIVCKGVSDKYTIGFLNGISYTENCYECKYAKRERISDITIGDSWGSTLKEDNPVGGISLMLIMTEKGKQLVENSNIDLYDVDVQNAIKNNGQLSAPSSKPTQIKTFWEGINDAKRFNRILFSCFSAQCIKQDVKYVLIKTGLIKK